MNSRPTKRAKTKKEFFCFLFFIQKRKETQRPCVLFSVFSLIFQHSNDLHFHAAACVLKCANACFSGT